MAEAEHYRHARRLANGTLLLLVALFLATHLLPTEAGWMQLLRSMAEAGMVGGLADWFAVTALFRHPLGLPIPHTALLPANQDRAARNVGRFFEEHFLDPAELEPRLVRLGPSRLAADWLRRPGNARLVARHGLAVVGEIARWEPPARLRVRARSLLRSALLSPAADGEIAATLATGVRQGIRSRMVDEIFDVIRRTVDDNREAAVGLVQDRSRWWIAAPVDRRVAGLAVRAVLSLLDELRAEDSDLRHQLEAAVDTVVDGLEQEGTLARAVGEARAGMIRNGTLDALAGRALATLREGFARKLDEDAPAITEAVERMLVDAARQLGSDPEAMAALDARLASAAAGLVGELRPALGGYVAGVIAEWHPDELIERFEAELGPDLQYIRVNGAVLGALIGGVLYAIDRLAG